MRDDGILIIISMNVSSMFVDYTCMFRSDLNMSQHCNVYMFKNNER